MGQLFHRLAGCHPRVAPAFSHAHVTPDGGPFPPADDQHAAHARADTNANGRNVHER